VVTDTMRRHRAWKARNTRKRRPAECITRLDDVEWQLWVSHTLARFRRREAE
jgi:hypothetical protein